MKKIITQQEYITLTALFHLACEHYKKCREFEKAAAEVLGHEDEYLDGWLAEVVYGERSFKESLKRDGITVKPTSKKKVKNGNS